MLSIDSVTLDEGDSGTTDFNFTVTLSPASTSPVTVDIATADGSATVGDDDYVGIPPGSFTCAPGATSLSVTVQVNGDTRFEPDADFFVS